MNSFLNRYIIHISHTNITRDNRIKKELSVLSSQFKSFDLLAIGLGDSNSMKEEIDYKIITLKLFFRSFRQLQIIRIPFIFINWIFALKGILNNKNIVIIHAHDISALVVSVLIKKRKTILIYDAHELESSQSHSLLLNKTILYIEKLIWFKVNHLITVSPSIQKWYLNNLGEKDSSLIYNVPELSNHLVYSKNYLKQKYNLPKDTKLFVHSGNLGRGRGIDDILRVFEDDNIKAVLVFLGNSLQWTAKVNHSKVYGSKVFIHEPVESIHVVQVLSGADCGIVNFELDTLNSVYALPNKLFEYMNAGIFIITTKGIDLSNSVIAYGHASVIENSYESLYKAIYEFISEAKDIEIIPDIPSEFTFDSFSNNLINLYYRLINRGQS